MTGHRTAISIIIPARNEADALPRTLAGLRGSSPHEVIVVDGGSEDETVLIARQQGARVIESPPGRGTQLRAGADEACGEILIFLHADTLLPTGFEDEVRTILSRPGVAAGAFRLRIDARGRSLRLVEHVVSFRSRVFRLPYGDQAIFMTRRMYEQVGGFDDVPLFEDVLLIKRARRNGKIVISQRTAATSPRRWLHHGVWRTTLRNIVSLIAFRLGYSPHDIARWRNRPGNARDQSSPAHSTGSRIAVIAPADRPRSGSAPNA